MPTIYTDGYLKGANKDALAKVAKDKHTDQATRDKAKALLAQKSGGSSSGSGTSSGSSGGSKATTSTAPGKLIPQGSGTTPGGGGVKTTGSETKATGSTGTKTGGAGSSTWLSDLSGSGGSKEVLDPSTLSDDQLNAWAAENSKLWHTNPELRGRYEAENKAIKALLDKRNGTTSTLDPTTGKWTTTGGSTPLTGALPGGGDTSGLWMGGPTAPAGGSSGLSAQEPLPQPTQQIDYGDLLEQLNQYIDQAQASTSQYEPSEWEKTAQALAQAALGMKYEDWTQSGQYAALADRYGLQGQQSMQDMLGQVASRTGGLASSYAATAAQQQYNDYMSRLEEVARQMYAGERSDAIQNAQLAGQYSDRDYGRYLDELSQYNRDRSFGFDVLSQALNQSNYQQEWQNKLDQQERQWQQAQYEDSLRWRADFQDRVEKFFALGGTLEELYQFPDLIAGSGYNNAELAAMDRYYTNLRQQGMAQPEVQPVTPRQDEIPGPQTEEPDQSPGYSGIVRDISEIEDKALGDAAKINQIVRTIQNAQSSGTISEAEARALLRQYGLEG